MFPGGPGNLLQLTNCIAQVGYGIHTKSESCRLVSSIIYDGGRDYNLPLARLVLINPEEINLLRRERPRKPTTGGMMGGGVGLGGSSMSWPNTSPLSV